MGRWAQRRLRGTSPSIIPPVPTLAILSITATGGNTVTILFTEVCNFTTGATAGTELTVQALGITDVFGTPAPPASSALVGIFGATLNPGDAWALTGQPTWLVDAIAFPAFGFCV